MASIHLLIQAVYVLLYGELYVDVYSKLQFCFLSSYFIFPFTEVRNTLKQLGVTALGKLEGEPVVIDLGNEEDQLLIFQGQEKRYVKNYHFMDFKGEIKVINKKEAHDWLCCSLTSVQA